MPLTTNYKLVYLHIKGVVGLLITKLRKVYYWVWVKKKLKSVNIWRSYKQERDCLMHFLRLLAVCWPDAQSAWDNHVLACNFAKCSPIFTARCYASAVIAMGLCLSVRLSVRHKSVFYRNGWTNRVGFWHVSFLPSVLHCIKRKFGYLQ